MSNKPEYVPLILSYGDGVRQDEIADFVKAIYEFHKEAKEQYPNQEVRYYFLPEDLVEMLSKQTEEK